MRKNRFFRRCMSLAVATAMAFTGLAGGAAAGAVSSPVTFVEAASASEASKVLKAKGEELKNQNGAEYKLYDIDRDGIKELLVGEIGARMSLQVYGYDPGSKSAFAMCDPIGGVARVSKRPGKKQIVVEFSGTSDYGYEIYKIKNNKLVSDTIYCVTWVASVGALDGYEAKYTKNGRTISERAFSNVEKKFQKLKSLW